MTGCHQLEPGQTDQGRRIVLVGNPNVGKSVVFNGLSRGYAEVSNYPGTTLTINAAPMGQDTLVDAPGTYSLGSPEPEARAALEILEQAAAVINVVDATSLERDLYLTLELLETGLPMVVALNMWDEVRVQATRIDLKGLEAALGVPVVPTTAVTGQGFPELRTALQRAGAMTNGTAPADPRNGPPKETPDEPPVVPAAHPLHGPPLRSLDEPPAVPSEKAPDGRLDEPPVVPATGPAEKTIGRAVRSIATMLNEPESEADSQVRAHQVRRLVERLVARTEEAETELGRLEVLLMEPRTGVPISLFVVGVAFYIIGKLVAQDLVGFTEGELMGGHYVPWMEGLFAGLLSEDSIPYKLLVGDFGVLTMTVSYILGLLLPLILAFYLLMALLEDSGYLPRLALLGDRALRKVGLNGRAIIPLILGLGCVTMATMTTRLLNTPRERNITLALLALSVPCSAQLGVILAMLAGLGLEYWLAYLGTIVLLFALVGAALDRLLPGMPSPLLMELPRLRRPRFKPVLFKTTYRAWAFIKEAGPIFAGGALLLGVLDLSGVLGALEGGLEPLTVSWLGLPAAASTAFIMGFVRRDFGAAGLYSLGLGPVDTLVSLVVITLFVPCIASALMIGKEKGARGMAVIWGFCILVAFAVGGALAFLLRLVVR